MTLSDQGNHARILSIRNLSWAVLCEARGFQKHSGQLGEQVSTIPWGPLPITPLHPGF